MSSSAVWDFFKKLDTKTVSCNLCTKTYKSSGNTTNLATHLKNKHHFAYMKYVRKSGKSDPKSDAPQKAKSAVGGTTTTLAGKSGAPMQIDELESVSSQPSTSFGEFEEPNTSGCVDSIQLPYIDEDSIMTLEKENNEKDSLYDETRFQSPSAQTPTQHTIVDFLGRSASFADGGERHVAITQALAFMICKDNMPFSCVEKEGMQRFCKVIFCPRYKLPSRFKITQIIEQKYISMAAIVKQLLLKTLYISLTSDILTVTNSTRSFIVMTAHFLVDEKLESISFSAKKMSQAHTADYIKSSFDEILSEFGIPTNKIVSMTTDGGANIVAAVKHLLGKDKRVPCMAHTINLVVDGTLKAVPAFSKLTDHVKSIVTFFKQSVNAMDDLRREQQSGEKKEGEVLTLIQAVSTRWNSCLDMLDRFSKLSAIVAKVLTEKRKGPDMIPSSQLAVIQELVQLLRPFKQATEEISGEKYVTASLVVPLSNLIKMELEQSMPLTEIGVSVREKLLSGVMERLIPLEKNHFLAKATLLDPRFKKVYFSSPLTVSHTVMEVSGEIRAEMRKRGKVSPDLQKQDQADQGEVQQENLWSKHQKLIQLATTQDVPRAGTVPSELRQYFDQPNSEKGSDPIKFWLQCQQFFPVLSEVALKYLIPPASSTASERVASAVNLAVPANRSRMTGEHIKERVFLLSLDSKYWSL